MKPENQKLDYEKDSNEECVQEQDSLQYNSQDLDQEQKVDVKPFQNNTQTVNAYFLENKKQNFSGTIEGFTYAKNKSKLLSKVTISLYFSNETKIPVEQITSDENGKFVINNLPPGYYTILAHDNSYLTCKYSCIKVLPNQIVYQPIFLQETYEKESYKYNRKQKIEKQLDKEKLITNNDWCAINKSQRI